MVAILLIVGAVWFALSGAFLFALCCAARKPAPRDEAEPVTLKNAA
jgi:hypothetical protein